MERKHNKEIVTLAKNLRKNMTKEERHLWYDFLKGYNIKFLRQKIIGKYIVDFYCAKAKLIIELDGSGHYIPDQVLNDRIRTERLEEMDLTVIRINNLDVDGNFYNVCQYIDTIVKCSLPQSASQTAPSSEGAK